ncbi:dienelactone hydrolase family protein [Halanaerobium salsuginis]|jgi:dienelactone hydrolase|uniref:Dienelactone hydrolase n=1 Tax=Halanaerobium salsuginis TaxID=29563 RepID=A0A1I4HW50_9FIRM|nr:dienelactone hydrolase family protein [Halanaerobium salsuginis]SFL46294.1 Dienelactone hydrolase [Halanaerobium salsuginis]
MKKNKDFSPDIYLEKLYQKKERQFIFKAANLIEWKLWRENLKAKLAEVIGGLPDQVEVDQAVTLLNREVLTDYIRLRISYKVKDYLELPAYLLLPKIKNFNQKAVVIAHGHGNGVREAVGLNARGEKLDQSTCHNDLAVEFAKAGYIVILPELIGFGDRRLRDDYLADPELKKDRTANSCYRISSQLLLLGQTTAKLRLLDLMSAVKYLTENDEFELTEINCVGFSGGAPIAILAALFLPEINAVMVSGYPSFYKDSIMARRHCLDNYLPGILNYAELPDILAAIAPKPLLLQAAVHDQLFPIESAKKAEQIAAKAYKLLHSSNKLDFSLIEGSHAVQAGPAIEFFNKFN